jgi:hypothetical protein
VEQFRTQFTHKAVYTLPDGTNVVALWTELNEQPRWWFVAEQGRTPGVWGDLQLVVYPNGSVYNYVPEPAQGKPEVFIPVPSDLCIDDLRPVQHVLVPNRR